MKTRTVIFLLAAMLIFLLAGCGAGKEGVDVELGADETDGELSDNPFDYEGPPEVLGSVEHGLDLPEGQELQYTGGELQVPYRAKGSDKGRNVGFLLFLDGVPQPYRLNGEGEYGFMRPFTLTEDDVEEEFTFNFVPVAGRAGDTATLTVADLFNAGFEPDMVNTSGFGLYGNAVSAAYDLHFAADPETVGGGGEPLGALTNVSVTNELMSAEFIERNLGPQTGMTASDGKTREDRLDETVYIFDTYDGREELNDLEVTGRETLHVAVDLCGIPGLSYRVSFFADHVPLSDGESFYWDVTLEKGKAARVEADLALTDLEAVTTFYAVACAAGGENDARGFGVIKTGSLPIWSRDKLDSSAPQGGGEGEKADTPAGTVTDTPEIMDGQVRSLSPGAGDTVLIRRTDGLAVYDMRSGEVLARGPLPDLKNAVYSPVDGGFCVLGEAEGGGGSSLLTPDDPGESGTVCVFLDSSLAQTDRVSLTALAGEGKNILCAASPDGQSIAFSVMNEGIFLYSRDTGAVTPLCGPEEGVTMATGLWFDDDPRRVLFAENSLFGTVDLDGGNFSCAGFEGFDPQGPVGCAGGRIFFNESFFVSSGAMAVVDGSDLTYKVYTHSTREGSGDLFVSRDGEYFATTAFDEGGITVRVYGTEDDRLRLEYAFEDENEELFNRSPGVLILDSLKLCLLKFGGYSDIPAKVVAVSFE